MAETIHQLKLTIQEWIRSAQTESDPDTYLGKRLLPRYAPWCAPLDLRADGRTINAQGRDICVGGVGFTCKQEFPRGTVIEMRPHGSEVWIPIRVRHSTATVSGYKIGARFVFE